jgi:ubiquinone/menaquinone biosynthesis C-methylase UbiE
MASTEPSVAVRALMEFATVHGIMLGPTALDIGCGKGRNALFLALHGFQVAAFDIVEEAISTLKKRAEEAGVKIAAHVGAMDELWPYSDNFFDLIVDDTASMSIGYESGIFVCREEMRRVLKPGGYVVIYSLANDDPFLLRFPLGEERNTIVTPDGKN